MFEPEGIYHIYNRANGDENLFREEKNYLFFLENFLKYIHPIAKIYAWCLMPNHFHVMIRIRQEEELGNAAAFQKFETFGKLETAILSKVISKQFSNFFSSYTQAYNKVYGRTGSLFQPNMKKKEVTSDAYFTQLVLYIHNNPVKHGFVKNLCDWPHHSYHYITGDMEKQPAYYKLSKSFKLLESSRSEVLDWFGGLTHFKLAHQSIGDIRSIFD
jgi:REP element-mobilizing transposase RayT